MRFGAKLETTCRGMTIRKSFFSLSLRMYLIKAHPVPIKRRQMNSSIPFNLCEQHHLTSTEQTVCKVTACVDLQTLKYKLNFTILELLHRFSADLNYCYVRNAKMVGKLLCYYSKWEKQGIPRQWHAVTCFVQIVGTMLLTTTEQHQLEENPEIMSSFRIWNLRHNSNWKYTSKH